MAVGGWTPLNLTANKQITDIEFSLGSVSTVSLCCFC